MKRYAILAFMVTAFGFGFSAAQAGEVADDSNAILHYEITWDGYCDGITLDIDTSNGIATGYWSNPCVTCPFTNEIAGTTGDILGPLGWTTNLVLAPGDYSSGFFARVNLNGTWAFYWYSGGILNSGTWSLCSPSMVSDQDAPPAAMPNGVDFAN
jgi:hypothetical protein